MSVDDADQLQRTFRAKYRCDTPVALVKVPSGFLHETPGASDLFSVFNGASFDGGLYRLLGVEQVSPWSSVANSAFPQFSNALECFSYDWLGRLFALDYGRLIDGWPAVVMLEPGSGQALEVPATFLTFHCGELIQFADAALAVEAYRSWRLTDRRPIGRNECVGYKVPLFLGGKDTIDNMERSDMAVYWDICAQLLSKIRDLPDGVIVSGIFK